MVLCQDHRPSPDWQDDADSTGDPGWLAALASPVAAMNFRPVDELVVTANQRLFDVEGRMFEKLVGQLYEERSRKGIGDFPLTARIEGYGDRGDTEIDLVAINGTDQIIRFGSCKRSADKLIADLSVFDGHIDRFLNEFPEYRNWQIERVSLAPVMTDNIRRQIMAQGRLAQDLHELTAGL